MSTGATVGPPAGEADPDCCMYRKANSTANRRLCHGRLGSTAPSSPVGSRGRGPESMNLYKQHHSKSLHHMPLTLRSEFPHSRCKLPMASCCGELPTLAVHGACCVVLKKLQFKWKALRRQAMPAFGWIAVLDCLLPVLYCLKGSVLKNPAFATRSWISRPD